MASPRDSAVDKEGSGHGFFKTLAVKNENPWTDSGIINKAGTNQSWKTEQNVKRKKVHVPFASRPIGFGGPISEDEELFAD